MSNKKNISVAQLLILTLGMMSVMATSSAQAAKASTAKTQFAPASEGRVIAFRDIGKGYPIILANRFRGNLDTWDPAFLDALAKSHRVIIFDYIGTGLSKGPQSESHMKMAQELTDLAKHLKIKKFAAGGWSYGGMIAQVALTEFPDIVSHGILIGTRLPGAKVSPPQKVFFERVHEIGYESACKKAWVRIAPRPVWERAFGVETSNNLLFPKPSFGH